MRAHGGQALDVDELHFDLQDIALGNMCDALFRIARAAATVNGHRMFASSQDFVDCSGLEFKLLYAFDGERLVIELRSEHDRTLPLELLRSRHECTS